MVVKLSSQVQSSDSLNAAVDQVRQQQIKAEPVGDADGDTAAMEAELEDSNCFKPIRDL